MIAIIRMKPGTLDRAESDIRRLSEAGFEGISFEIPTVRVLKRSVHGEDVFENKPLLFSYGFISIPMTYLKSPLILTDIRNNSEIISGFFYRKPRELDEERLQREVDNPEEGDYPLPAFVPVLVKSIKKEQLELLYAEAKNLDVYDNSDGLQIDAFVVLQKYPFNGLSAQIKRKKTNGKVQVLLLESGLRIWLDQGSVLYTPYSEDASYNNLSM